jgi:hypothetical protein
LQFAQVSRRIGVPHVQFGDQCPRQSPPDRPRR